MRVLPLLLLACLVVGFADARGKNRGSGGSRGKYGGGGRQQSRNPSYERERQRDRNNNEKHDSAKFQEREREASQDRTQAKPAPKWPVVKPSAPGDHKADPSKIGWNVPPAQTQHRAMPQPGTGLQHNSHQQSANPPPYNPAFGQQQKPPYPVQNSGVPQPNAGIGQPHPGIGQPQPGYPQPNAGFGQAKAPYPQPNPAYPNQSPGFPQQNAGFPQQNPGFPQQNPGFPQQNPGFPPPNSGFPQQAYPQGFPNQQVPHYHPPAGYPQQFPPNQGMYGSGGFGSPMGGGMFPPQYGQNRGGLGTGGALAAGLGAGVLGGVVGAVGANLASSAIRNKFNNDRYDNDRAPAPGAAPVAPLPDGTLPADPAKMDVVPAVNMTGNMTANSTDEGFTSETPSLASTDIPMAQPNPYYNPYYPNQYYNPYYPNPYYQPQGTWVNGTFVPYMPPYQTPDGQPIPYVPAGPGVPPVGPEGAQNPPAPMSQQPVQGMPQNGEIASTTVSTGSTTNPSETSTSAPQKDGSTVLPITTGAPVIGETTPAITTAKA